MTSAPAFNFTGTSLRTWMTAVDAELAGLTPIYGTAAALTASNPTLADNQVAIETDTKRSKMGPGAYNSLSYTYERARYMATAAVLASDNPITVNGREYYETDTGRRKIGNGSAYNSIGYSGVVESDLAPVALSNSYNDLDDLPSATIVEATGGLMFSPPSAPEMVRFIPMAPVVLTDAATITLPIGDSFNFNINGLAGLRTLAASGLSSDYAGMNITIRVQQDATGSRGLSPGTGITSLSGAITLDNDGPNQVSIIPGRVNAAGTAVEVP